MASSLEKILGSSAFVDVSKFTIILFPVPRLHGNMVALEAIVLLGDVDLVRDGSPFRVTLVVDGGLSEIGLHILKVAEMTAACTRLTHAIIWVVVAEVSSEQFARSLLEIAILE